MCRIFARMSADFLDEKLWPQQHEWLRQRLELFHKVLAPVVRTLE